MASAGLRAEDWAANVGYLLVFVKRQSARQIFDLSWVSFCICVWRFLQLLDGFGYV